MQSALRRTLATTLSLVLSLQLGWLPASATCGGGGGGGMGGANPGGGSGTADTYRVPWKILAPGTAAPDGDLILYWFPNSPDEVKTSELLGSRYLTLSAAQCVSMDIVTNNNGDLRGKYAVAEGQALIVLAAKEGAELGRVKTDGGKLRVDSVEDLLRKEIDRQEDVAKNTLDSAKEKVDQKDVDAGAALYTKVWGQRCLLPGPAKKAAKALKKLGKPVPETENSRLDLPPANWSEPLNTKIIQTMQAGLAAERDGKYTDAKRLYASARKMDPSDPVPARFLGELLRHHIGDWSSARATFNQVLAMPADPLSRAVALHGLGKMTIHDGDFKKGVALFGESIDAYPLALTYRNLAVYWNSEKDPAKAYDNVTKAMALDPDDEYNQIFAATYLVELGHPQEAAEVARQHEQVLAASYNLAAIYAQLGNKQKSLELLRRHFYVYEQFEAVRVKEMQEARDDIAFARYHQDPDFVKLTAPADQDETSYHRKGA